MGILRLGIYRPWLAMLLGAVVHGAPTRPERVFFIVNAQEHDAVGHGDPKLDEQTVMRDLRGQLDADVRFVVVRKSSNTDIRDELARQMKPAPSVAGLYVLSHGESRVWDHPKATGLARRYAIVVRSESLGFSVNLVDRGSVSQVFKPLVGHFEPGAKLLFRGCELLKAVPSFARRPVMEDVARNFELRQGALYMNEESGNDPRVLDQPVAGLPTQARKDLTWGPVPLLLPYLRPLLQQAIRATHNKGYLLRIAPGSSQIYRDDLLNAQSHGLSLEEQKARTTETPETTTAEPEAAKAHAIDEEALAVSSEPGLEASP